MVRQPTETANGHDRRRRILLALVALVATAVVVLAVLAGTYQPVQFGEAYGGAFPGLPAGTAFRTVNNFGGATGQTYRINHGRIANIDVLDAAGKVMRRLCAHPALDVPDCDTMLAQALHLQSAANEEQFVSIANVRQVR